MKKTEGVLLKFEPEFLSRIDAVRGDVPRTVWIRRCIEVGLASATDEASAGRVGGSFGSAKFLQPAPQAEPPAVRHEFRPVASLQLGPTHRKPGAGLKKR